MLRLIGIVFLNLWHGLSRKNGAPAMMVLIVALVAVLGLTHNSAAKTDNQNPDHLATTLATPNSKSGTGSDKNASSLAFVNPRGADGQSTSGQFAYNNPAPKAPVHKSDKKSNKTGSGSDNASSGDNKANIPTVQLASANPPVCTNGQTTATIESATVSLNNAKNSIATIKWYWEMQLVSGQNTSDTQPINTTAINAVPVSPDSDTVIIQADDPTNPLLTATSQNSYSYKFRLHVVVGSTDIASSWVNLPQSQTACESQN